MSYRDLRNFTEMMRALGYSRLISMENFRTPNFDLVAEILVWLAERLDPDCDLKSLRYTIEGERDRVQLVRTAAQLLAVKGSIKLNTKKLYQADGYAVKELLKISSVLYEAVKKSNSPGKLTNGDNETTISTVDFAGRIQDLKMTRELASKITSKGATLYELLGKEVQLREARSGCVGSQVEVSFVERGLEEALVEAKQSVANAKGMIESVASTEAALDAKIEKKQLELERNRKRLITLRKVRPPFQEELERLEVELGRLYLEYVARFRCITYLEQQVEDLEQAEQERMEQKQAATRRMVEEMRQEEALKLLEENNQNQNHGLGETGPADYPTAQPVHHLKEKPLPDPGRIRSAARGRNRIVTGRRVYGGMTGDDEGGSLDTDSEDLLLDDDEEDDLEDNSRLIGSDDDDYDDLELLNNNPPTNNAGINNANINNNNKKNNLTDDEDDDDDF